MFRDLFAELPLLALPIAAMLLFFGIFLLVLVRVACTRAAHYRQLAQLPLDDDCTRRTER